MNRIIWGVALAAIMVWSLLTWGSYVLVTQGSEWLAGAGAIFALPQEWQFGLEWSLRLVEQFGVALLWVLWGMVVVVTLFGAWLATRLVGASLGARIDSSQLLRTSDDTGRPHAILGTGAAEGDRSLQRRR